MKTSGHCRYKYGDHTKRKLLTVNNKANTFIEISSKSSQKLSQVSEKFILMASCIHSRDSFWNKKKFDEKTKKKLPRKQQKQKPGINHFRSRKKFLNWERACLASRKKEMAFPVFEECPRKTSFLMKNLWSFQTDQI